MFEGKKNEIRTPNSEIKIMLVEDEFIEAKCLKKSLENSGYAVSAIVNSGEKAIKYAQVKNLENLYRKITGTEKSKDTLNVLRKKGIAPELLTSI